MTAKLRIVISLTVLATAPLLALPIPTALAATATTPAPTATPTRPPGPAVPPARSATATPSTAPTRPTTAATATTRVRLPRPTGPDAVGRATLHLVDRARRDPWAPGRRRELMVDVYYPAVAGTGRPARYATPEEVRLYLTALDLATVLPVRAISDAAIASRTGARPLPGRHPLVLLSPGLGVGRRSLTGLAEQLASQGMVAATVDHAYESTGTAFPGGRMLTCLACVRMRTDADFRAASRTRGDDLAFVLTSLTGPHPAWSGAATIDPARVGAAGHSLGGSAALSLLARDPRVRAGVDMDGTLGEPVPAGGFGAGRAVLLLGALADHPGPGGTLTPPPDDPDLTWHQAWPRLRAPRLWLDVDDADHFSFTDDPVIADQLPLPNPTGPPPISGAQALRITRAYVGAFLTRWLTGTPQPLLDGPSRTYPQVRVIGR
ncbi:conserved exported hypothetical protein [Frankia canadensis]|uniref:Uncharacterized protein n=1 Tax=Frankia canadensis TaxID=1836972 RepID=A0A2I2KP19_9ACTN|nr:lipase [Frankia canadensis]SNQ47396.1 conserved exported hypothetical protein [Frankia canadensis]SOU54686.1 conserved exported hypothetical protein [Frankia canadensis]